MFNKKPDSVELLPLSNFFNGVLTIDIIDICVQVPALVYKNFEKYPNLYPYLVSTYDELPFYYEFGHNTGEFVFIHDNIKTSVKEQTIQCDFLKIKSVEVPLFPMTFVFFDHINDLIEDDFGYSYKKQNIKQVCVRNYFTDQEFIFDVKNLEKAFV